MVSMFFFPLNIVSHKVSTEKQLTVRGYDFLIETKNLCSMLMMLHMHPIWTLAPQVEQFALTIYVHKQPRVGLIIVFLMTKLYPKNLTIASLK